MDEVEKVSQILVDKYPNAVFFGGQLVFEKESIWTKWLHNFTVFAMQRLFYTKGTPFVVLPIRV